MYYLLVFKLIQGYIFLQHPNKFIYISQLSKIVKRAALFVLYVKIKTCH